jgi:DNA polymerase I-like protein with 3'-5' exonuclease and polymerase domains
MPDIITLDYETEGIEGNPIFNPPRPVGVAIKVNDQPAEYLGWGHPTNNNCTEAVAKQRLGNIFASDAEILCHNAPFDMSIAAKYHGFKMRKAERIHDTMYPIFFTDPYAMSLSLKPSAERILGLPPDEQNEVRDWLLANYRPAVLKPSEWGAHICQAPGDIVGRYAIGDVDRTYAIFQKLMPMVAANGMSEAYLREQQLMPISMESSKQGIRVNLPKLQHDLELYLELLGKVDRWFYRKLGCEFDLNKDAQLADALEVAGIVKPDEWILTLTGKRSTAKKNLVAVIPDKDLLTRLSYRGALSTMLTTFMGPWSQLAAVDGRLHTQWNQVRADRGSDIKGARTGRLSSSGPNFQNVPNEQPVHVPKWPELPLMRQYLLPEEGCLWAKRDFSAQEMRIAAHYAEGSLAEAFRNDPSTDPHTHVQGIIKELTGLELARKKVKETGFQILYGGGAGAIAAKLDISVDEALGLKETYYAAMPEMHKLSRATNARGRSGGFIRTWGGRIYYTEPSRVINGRNVDFSYKLLNYLIQGSAADQTKQSVIDWYASKGKGVTLLAQVHDEINISVPVGSAVDEMAVLRNAMNKNRFDVPFLSEGFFGTNWQDLQEAV